MKKTLAELQAIREKTINNVNQRVDRENTRIVIGMATCGIAAGAREVLKAIMEEVEELGLDVSIAQTGCMGLCALEPLVEVYMPGATKVTYTEMTPEKAREMVREHLRDGKPVAKYMKHIAESEVEDK